MPLKGKYIKYSQEITLEIFTLIYNKLINSGWTEYSDKIIEVSYSQFKTQYNYLTHQQDKTFNTHVCPYEKEYAETTVQEILGYDPFVKEEFALPQKWRLKITKENSKIINNWRNDVKKISSTCPDTFIEETGLGTSNEWGIEITFDQFKKYVLRESIEKPKQPLKQAVHCKTQEEYKFAKETLGATFNSNAYIEGESIIPLDAVGSTITLNRFGHLIYNDYNLLSFQEWCDLNGYKMESNQEFKINDWVCHIKLGTIYQIIRFDNDGWAIGNIPNGGWNPVMLRHATPEEINNHLISIGQIPAGEPLNNGIEPNKDGVFHCVSVNRGGNPLCEFTSISINGEEIYNKNKFNIINKTKTIKF